MNSVFKTFVWLVFELILGTLLFGILIGLTISLVYLVTWAKQFGLDSWVITILEFCKAVAFTIEAILYLVFVLKSAYNFLKEQIS